MKRKALAITLAAAMAMGTCAVTASAADGDKYTIGICQLVQHEALDAASSPSSLVTSSLNPCVAASRASCCTS